MSEEAVLLINRFLSLNWDAVAGLFMAPIFFGFAIYFLITGKWPWPRTEHYRTKILAGIFLLLGCWSAAGVSGITRAFGNLLCMLIVLAFLYAGLWAIREWFFRLPLVGERFVLGTRGEVEVIQVTGDTPVDADISYAEAETGETHHMSAIRFVCKARPVSHTEN